MRAMRVPLLVRGAVSAWRVRSRRGQLRLWLHLTRYPQLVGEPTYVSPRVSGVAPQPQSAMRTVNAAALPLVGAVWGGTRDSWQRGIT